MTSPDGAIIRAADLQGTVEPGYFGPDVEADAVWYYNWRGEIDGGMAVGEGGIVAVRGCEIVAQRITSIIN